jgi:7-cyano-7-deazaguanine synthase
LDSTILLGSLLEQGRQVQPFYIRARLTWEAAELQAVRHILEALAGPQLERLIVLSMPLDDLYLDHWSLTGREVPGAASPDEAVYLPGRNPLLLIKPLVWCHMHGIAELALALLGTNPFADARAEFLGQLELLMDTALGGRVKIVRPLAELTKQQVMQMGRGLPLERTFSCIAPRDALHCGHCNKCSERQAAFRLIEAADPTRYAASPR